MSFLRSSSSSAFFLAAFDAAFFAGVADFFRGLTVSFEVFFIAMARNVTQLRVDCEIYLVTQRQPSSRRDVVTPLPDPNSDPYAQVTFE